MNSNIEYFSNVIPASESGSFMLTAPEIDQQDAGHEWVESEPSDEDVWSLDPDEEEIPDAEEEEEETEEEEIEALEPTA